MATPLPLPRPRALGGPVAMPPCPPAPAVDLLAGEPPAPGTAPAGETASGAGVRDPFHQLLWLRFALLNLVGVALLAIAHREGLVGMVVAADQTYLCVLIAAVFAAGLALAGRRAWTIGRELDAVRVWRPGAGGAVESYLRPMIDATAEQRANLAGALRLKLVHRITVVRHVASNLVLLGLVGTVVGFIIALSGVDPEKAGDVGSVAPMVSELIRGMSTALYTTLVGAVLNIWLTANHQLLAGATVKLIARITEVAEAHARDRSDR